VLKENIFLLENIFGVFYELPKIMRDVKSALCPVYSDIMSVENSLDDINGYAISVSLSLSFSLSLSLSSSILSCHFPEASRGNFNLIPGTNEKNRSSHSYAK